MQRMARTAVAPPVGRWGEREQGILEVATALYAAEGDRSPWLVFFASAAALVTSTAIATLLGGVAREFISGQLIKIIAGAGFVLVGCFVLWTALKPS